MRAGCVVVSRQREGRVGFGARLRARHGKHRSRHIRGRESSHKPPVGDLASVPSERTPKIANSFLDAVYGYFKTKTDSHTYQRGPIFYLTPVRCLPVLYSTESQNVGSSVGRSERLAYM
jgi:hypothetical protein